MWEKQSQYVVNGNASFRHRRKSSHDSLNSEEDNFSFFIYSVPSILAVLCYISSLNGDFVHDDIFAIKNNGDVTGANSIGQLWRHDFWGHPMDNIASHKSYRPLTTLSFRLDYWLSPGDPRWFHVVNVILHALVTCFLSHVCLHVIHTSQLCALLTSSLFAVHPIHTEAVSGIVGRADVLAALFFLLSFMMYSKSTQQSSLLKLKDANDNRIKSSDVTPQNVFSLMTSLVFAASATLCKETGITVLGVCFLYDVFKHQNELMAVLCSREVTRSKSGSLSSLALRLGSLVTAVVVLLLARAWIMDYQLPVFQEEDNPASYSSSFLTRVLTYNFLVPFNTWLMLCPSVLCYDWQVGSIPLVETLADPRNLCTLAFYVPLMALVRTSWRELRQKDYKNTEEEEVTSSEDSDVDFRVPVLSMALVLTCVPFIPASNLFFPVGFVVAERVLYIPSMGFCLLVGLGVSRMCHTHPKFKGHCLTFLFALILMLAVRTWHRNKVWSTRHSLFRSGVSTLPMNAKVHYNMANLCKDTGDLAGAITHYKRAIELYPNHTSYHNNLGTLLSDRHEAEFHFRQSLAIHPHHKGAMVNLGNLLIDHGNDTGLTFLQMALDLDPLYTNALLSLGKAMIAMERYGEAESYIKQAIQLEPGLADTHIYYGALFQKTGQLELAVREFQEALKINTANTDAMKNAASSLQSLGRFYEAEEILKRALAFKREVETFAQLGGLYSAMGKSLEALFAYREAVSIYPNDTTTNLKYIKALIDSNQKEEAEVALNRLVSHHPHSYDVLKFAYMFADNLGKADDALQYAHEALVQAKRVKPSAVGVIYNDLANMYRKQPDLDKSLMYFQLAIEADPSLIKAYINIGTIHHINKNYAEAEKFYLEALSRDPKSEVATNNLQKLRNVWKKGKT